MGFLYVFEGVYVASGKTCYDWNNIEIVKGCLSRNNIFVWSYIYGLFLETLYCYRY